MDKHIFHCDEVANDDDSYDASYDDNHVSLFVIKPFVCSHPRDNSSWVHVHEVGLLSFYQ
jgi:hypothetical protein